jgi:UDP-glucose 4-epimerase
MITLVTGGAGFIGSHLVEALAARGERVRVLDNFSTGQRGNLTAIRPAPEIIDGDVADPSITGAMRDVHTVYHLAAVASVQKSLEDPLETHRVCATGTLNVLHAARQAGVRKLVYAASASAYGIPAGDVQRESDPVCPISPYGAGKLAGELYAGAFASSFQMDTVCLRFFNVFGPRQRADSPYSGVIALFIAAMLAGRRPRIFGDGKQSRDFVHVGDIVQALTLAAQAKNAAGQVFNVGNGTGVDLLELVNVLNRVLGIKLEAEFGPPRAGDIRHSRADITRIQQVLHYVPRVSFEEGLRNTVDWYKASGGR